MYFLNMDESDDPTLLALCGVAIAEQDWRTVERRVNGLKKEFFPDLDPYSFELKSRAIRRHEYPFGRLSTDDHQGFVKAISSMIVSCPITVIGSVVDIRKMNEASPDHPDPYRLAYAFLMDQFERYLEKRAAKGIMVIDQRSDRITRSPTNPDRALKNLHGSFRLGGTDNTPEFRCVLENLFVVDSYDHVGVQLADLCAYALYRAYKDSNPDFESFRVLRHSGRFHSDETGRIHGYGLTIFPGENNTVWANL